MSTGQPTRRDLDRAMTAGVVIAGGRSSRFGTDKAVADLGGLPLIAYPLRVLAAASRETVVNGPPALAAAMGVQALPDPPGRSGSPLFGLLGALDWAAARGFARLITSPCDTPFLPLDLGAKLQAGLGAHVVVAARCGGAQPLCGLWRVEAADLLRARLTPAGRHPSLTSLIEQLGGAWVDFEDPEAFANINTREDFVHAERRLGGGDRRGSEPVQA